MAPKVLIISEPGDVHALAVCKHLEPGACQVVDSGEMSSGTLQVGIQLKNSKAKAWLDARGQLVDLDELVSVWNRKPSPIHYKAQEGIHEFCRRESYDSLYGFLWNLELEDGVRLYNHPFFNYFASIKPYQLLHARRVGLSIPDTTIGNMPSLLETQAQAHPNCILKGVSLSCAVANGEHFSIYARRLTDDIREHLASASFCPVSVQEEIARGRDLRVVAIDQRVFAFALEFDSETNVDWRRLDESAEIRHHSVALDTTTERAILDLHRLLKIRFSTVDLIEDRSGRLVFLELNPNGQWLWLEERTGIPLSRAMAEALAQ